MRSPRVWSGYEFVVPYEITQRHWAAHPLIFSPFLSNPQQIRQAQCLVLLLIFFISQLQIPLAMPQISSLVKYQVLS